MSERDARIEAAVQNWAPRFLANGVDPSDFDRVTGKLERWTDWCRIWSEAADVHRDLAERAEAQGHGVSAGEHYRRASVTYHFGKFLFFENRDEAREASRKTVEMYDRGLPYYDWPGERVEVPFEGATLAGILRKPWHAGRAPLVVLSPGLDSVKEELHGYGDDFLRRGMAVFAMDGPGQGEGETLPLGPHYERPVGAVLDVLQRRSDLDMGRVGFMGVSLGGFYAPRVAAHERRLKAAIAVAGGVRILDSYEQLPSLTRDAFRTRQKAADESESRRLLEAWDIEEDLPHIDIPLLVVHGRLDRLLPAAAAELMAARSPRGELWMFEDGNHVCNNIAYRYRPAQADWMAEKLQGA